ncbi:hypothetical protein [Yinghuangia soli]|uniref:hypothetical protein n=1 Tax=Yinghuangia soli TaxID=2908204 RepID=UPI001F21BD81|nr:hypothetical protein [Yinghuangia soli]
MLLAAIALAGTACSGDDGTSAAGRAADATTSGAASAAPGPGNAPGPGSTAPSPSAPASPRELVFGTAVPTGPRIKVSVTDERTWPQACDLLTDAELKAIVPWGGPVERSPLGPVQPKQAPQNLRYVYCNYAFHNIEGSTDVTSSVEIKQDLFTDQVGTYYTRNKTSAAKRDGFEDYGTRLGMPCYRTGAEIVCQGRYSLVSASGRSPLVPGDTTQAKLAYWCDKVIVQVVRQLAAKLG